MTTTHLNRRVALAALVAGALTDAVVFPTAAHAADDKTAPGSNCVASTGNNPDGTRFSLLNSTLFYADSGGALRVDCPIMKERIGKGIARASVFVIDNNPNANVECQLFSERVTPNAEVVQRIGPTVRSAGASTVTRQLNLGSLPAVPGIGSHWFIGCTLLPFTGINSYYVDEQQ